MNQDRTNARIVGALFIIAIVAPLCSVPFTRFVEGPDALVSLSSHASEVEFGALLEAVMASSVAGIAIFLYPVPHPS